MITEKCSHCGNSMKGKRKGTKYCSDTCKQKAYQARKNDEIEERPRLNMCGYQEAYSDHWGWTIVDNRPNNEGSDLDMITYLFLSRNMPRNLSDLDKVEFILSHARVKDGRFDEVRKSKAFLDFKEDYLNGKYEVVNEEVPKSDTN